MHLTPTNRRIFYHLKLNTMVQTDISQLTAECNQWRENLHSHRDDLHHLKHKLQQVAGKPLTKDQLTDLEHFQNQLHIQLINIHIVHHLKKPAKEADMPDKHDSKGSGSITDQVDNVMMVWRNKPKEEMGRAKGHNSTKQTEPDTYLLCRKQRNYEGSGDGEPTISLWRHRDAGCFVANSGDSAQFFANYPHHPS